MTLIVRNHSPGFEPHSYFGNLWDDFQFLQKRPLSAREDRVHVQSLEDKHELSIAAPGLKKSDFSIQLKGDELTISYDACAQEDVKTSRSFSKSAFSRTYSISRSTTPEDIRAKYSAGVLKVTVNRPENEAPAEHNIKIN